MNFIGLAPAFLSRLNRWTHGPAWKCWQLPKFQLLNVDMDADMVLDVAVEEGEKAAWPCEPRVKISSKFGGRW